MIPLHLWDHLIFINFFLTFLIYFTHTLPFVPLLISKLFWQNTNTLASANIHICLFCFFIVNCSSSVDLRKVLVNSTLLFFFFLTQFDSFGLFQTDSVFKMNQRKEGKMPCIFKQICSEDEGILKAGELGASYMPRCAHRECSENVN